MPRAAGVPRTQTQAALNRANRQRGIEAKAERLREVLRDEWAHQPQLLEDALGKQMLALVIRLEAACAATDQPAKAVQEVFPQRPDSEIPLSFPGLGIQLAVRVLAEIGDDRSRFVAARGLKAYAGSSPITRASGKKSLTRRWLRTTGSTMPATCGPSLPGEHRPGPTRTTGADANKATGTPPPSATCSTA